MNKKFSLLCLICLAVSGFAILGLQYKVTELSLELPKYEEAFLQKKQMLEKAELELRMLKNPKSLFDENQIALTHLVFPKNKDVIALKSYSAPLDKQHDAKSSSVYLPLAKVFP